MTGLPKGTGRVDDRGAATALSHVLVIGITAVLLSGLLVGLSTFVDGQQEASTRDQLETIGNRVADQLARVDSLGARGNASLRAEFPDRVNQNRYTMEVVPPDDCDGTFVPGDLPACLELEAPGAGVTVYVPLDNRTAVSVSDPDSGMVRLASAGPGTGSSTGVDRVPLTKLSPRVGVAENIGDFGFNTSFRDFNAEPEPAFEVTPEFPTSDTPVTLNGSPSSDPDGTVVSYEWDVDGDGNYEETGERVTRTFEPGDYEVSLRVTDDKGATVTSESENISISGLEYQDDLAAGGGGVVSFTVYNEWDRSVELSELFMNPENDGIDELEASVRDEIEIETAGADDEQVNFDDPPDPNDNPIDQAIRPVGFIADLDQPDDETVVSDSPTIPANTAAEITIDRFDEGMGDETVTFAVDYIIDGGTKTTRFTDTTAPRISDYEVVASGQDIDVTFRSSSELDVITVAVGGAVSDDTLSRSDFTETDTGDAYEYRADIATGVTGTVSANLTTAESADGVASRSPPLNDTVTASSADYRWYTTSDWNNNRNSTRVVHDDFGDRQADQVMLGYPAFDRRADRNNEPRELLGYWTFDEESGDTVADVTNNGYDGEVKGFGNTDASKNDPTRDVTGIHGTTSWKFNEDSASEDEVFIDDEPELRGGDDVELTATAWVNFGGSIEVDNGRASILGKQEGTSEGDWGLMVTDQNCPSWADCADSSPPYVGYYGEQDGEDYALFAGMPSDSQWHHVAVQVDGQDDDVTVLIDGEVEAETNNVPDDFSGDTTHPVEIGRTEYQEANLEGKVDEVRLYDRELSNDEVQDLYEAGTEGNFETSNRTGPELNTDQMSLTHSGEIDSDESVNVTVYAYKPPPGNSGNNPGNGNSGGYEVVDTVTLDSSSGTTALNPDGSEFDGKADDFYLEVELDSPSPAGSPVIDSLGLVDTS